MKTMFTLAIAWIALTHSTNSLAASSVSVVIDGETYSCSKGGNDDTRDCTVTKGGQTDKYGTLCLASGGYCGTFYEFGQVAETSAYGSVTDAANWCRQKLRR